MLVNTGRLSDHIRIDHVYDAAGTYDGTTTAMDIDMQGWDGCLVLLFGTGVAADGTHYTAGLKVISNSDSDGGGTDTDIAEAVTTDGGTTKTLTNADYGTAANTTVNSQLIALDVRASQMPQGDRYIAAYNDGQGTWPVTIVYIRYNGDHVFKDVIQAIRTAFQYDGAL